MTMPIAVRRLDERARAALTAHLLALPIADQRLRFGQWQKPSAIAAYVERIDFRRDAILGVHDGQAALVGLAHVALDGDPAEVALSVSPVHRARGVATALFGCALAQAGGRRIRRVFMQFVAANVPILRLAQRFGMTILVHGRDAEAHLRIAANAATPVASADADIRARIAVASGGACA